MTLRIALVLLVIGFLGLLVVMGAVVFIRWLRLTHPRHYRSILGTISLVLIGLSAWGIFEALDRPSFHAGDLITLQEPLVVRLTPPDRQSAVNSCIVDIYEHLAVVGTNSGTMKARVESNKSSGPGFCPNGADVQFELAWLHNYTLTHRHT